MPKGTLLRPVAPLPAIDLGADTGGAPSAAARSLATTAPEGALVLLNTAMPSTLQLRFLRLEGNELLLSRVKDAPPDQCKRYPTSQLRGVEHINGHTFAILCDGAPPLRFEAHDAYTSKAWEQLLGPALDKKAVQVPSPTTVPSRLNTATTCGRDAPRPGGSGGLSPRTPITLLPLRHLGLKPSRTQTKTVDVSVTTAYSRGWHINTGQRGLKQLGSIPNPRGLPPQLISHPQSARYGR